MQLGLFRHHGEYFPLDGRRPILDAIDHVETEEVQTGVDFVANKGLRLLYEALDLSVLLRDIQLRRSHCKRDRYRRDTGGVHNK